MESAVSASGAPRKTAGIVSKNVWVIAMDIINTEIIKGDVISNKNAEKLRTNSEIKFTWIPGVRPVIIPAKHPNSIAINISVNI